MKNLEIDDEKLLNILLAQNLITQEQKKACLTYQEEYLRRTDEKVPIPKILQKLEILPLDKIVSIVKAIEGSKAPAFEEEVEDDDDQEEQEIAPKPRLVPSFLAKEEKVEKEHAKFLMERKQKEEEKGVSAEEPEKSIILSYFLLLFFGIFGAHRLYLRCYRSGILYGLTFGLFGVGVLIDIILVPFLLKSYRKDKEERKSEWQNMARYEEPLVDMPAWSKKEKSLQKLTNAMELFLQFFYLLLAPILLAVVAIIFWQPLIPVVVLIWITLFLASNSLRSHFSKRSLWKHVPFLEFLHQRMLQAEGFYFENEPKSLWIYLLYPIWMPLMILFKPKRREELYCYLWIILGGMGLLFFGLLYLASLFSFQYTPVLQSLLIIQGIVWLGSLILFLSLGIPYFTSLMCFKVKKNNFLTKSFAGWGWLICFLVFLFLVASPHFISWKTYSHQSALRSMISKLQSPEYKTVLENLVKSLPDLVSKEQKSFSADSAKEYTKTLRLFIKGISSCKEVQTFNVSYLEGSQKMLIHLEQYPLAVMEQDGLILYKWSDIKEENQKDIEKCLDSCIVCPYIEEYRKKLDIPVHQKMLGDF